MQKVWFITGSSRGLGRSLTTAVLENGDLVAATARNISQLSELVTKYGDRILPVTLDVTDTTQIRQAVEDTLAKFGRIDVLVNNAGFGITGAAEAFTDEQVLNQLNTNLYGPIQITRAILPHMRERRAGRILQISSIGGRVASIGLTMYQSAKFGLAGFSEALAKEVAELGIKVTCVEPGGFRTDWAGDSMTYAREVEGYGAVANRINNFKSGFVFNGSPEKAAKAMLELAEHPAPPVHLLLGSDAAAILKQAFVDRQTEFEQWLPVTLSTDYDK